MKLDTPDTQEIRSLSPEEIDAASGGADLRLATSTTTSSLSVKEKSAGGSTLLKGAL